MVRLPACLAIAAAMTWAAPAWAGDATDAPMVTADASATAPVSVADQIDAYLRSSPALELPPAGPDGVVPREEARKVHGVASISVGTGGYRSAYLRSDLPVGKTGTLSIAVQDTRFGRNGGYGYGGYDYRGYGAGHRGFRGGPGGARGAGVGLNFDAADLSEHTTCRSAWNPDRAAGLTPPDGRADCDDARRPLND